MALGLTIKPLKKYSMGKYRIEITTKAEEHIAEFKKNNPHNFKRCKQLLSDINNDPRRGIGKPERLKHLYPQEVWTRRIDRANRLVYIVYEADLLISIVSCRGHYP